MKYHKLTFIRELDVRNNSNNILWECLCDCGNTTIVMRTNVVRGHTKSCGCLRYKSKITIANGKKLCYKCHETKPLTEFNKDRSRPDGYCCACRQCNKIAAKPRKKHEKSIKQKRAMEFVDGYKSNPCVDCGNCYPSVCMDFDHVPEYGVKISGISKLVKHGYSTAYIFNEIQKCDLVCSNCHRIRTAIRGNWKK